MPLTSILILSSQLHLDFTSAFFPSGFQGNPLYELRFSPMRATLRANLLLPLALSLII